MSEEGNMENDYLDGYDPYEGGPDGWITVGASLIIETDTGQVEGIVAFAGDNAYKVLAGYKVYPVTRAHIVGTEDHARNERLRDRLKEHFPCWGVE